MAEELCDYLLQEEGELWCRCKFPCEYQSRNEQMEIPIDVGLTEVLRYLPSCTNYVLPEE